MSFPQALRKIPKCRPTRKDARGRPGKRYTMADMMRLKLGVKRVAARFTAEERAAANPGSAEDRAEPGLAGRDTGVLGYVEAGGGRG